MALCYTNDMNKRTTIWLRNKDREAIRAIRERYGSESDSAAIRFALRILAAQGVKIGAESAQDQVESKP